MADNVIIEVKGVSKKFGKINALEDINFSVKEQELFGFIGPDGAGKTTLFRILTTLLLADTGTAKINGLDVVKDFKVLRKSLGYMPGRFSLYHDLSVEENLSFFASIFGTSIAENYELVKKIYSHIEPFKTRKAGALSGGMKQKLALSCALIHRPKVLVLDEPTTGVDALARKEFWELLRELKREGITIVVSTPYMDEAEMCDRVALIQRGQILSIDTPQNITGQFKKNIYAIKSKNNFQVSKILESYPHTHSALIFGQVVHYMDKRDQADLEGLKAFIYQHTMEQITLERIGPLIEDCFIDAVNQLKYEPK